VTQGAVAEAVVLRVERLSKTFPGQRAVDGVSLTIGAGEIYALVGQNGSGKSTIVKILAGYHRADPGAGVVFCGEDLDLDHPHSREQARMHFIHQDLALVPTLNAIDNVALARGFTTGRLGRIRWRAERARVHARLQEFGIDLDVSLPVGQLNPAEQTMVAIIRALDGWRGQAGLLVLDEPTAALAAPEVRRLFETVRRVAATGVGVLFVSHRLEEVLDLADRVGVLRDGRLVTERAAAELTQDELAALIAGRRVEELYANAPAPRREVVLAARSLRGQRLRELSFDLHAGEILGVTGLLGSGREEVADVLFGSAAEAGGTVLVDGQAVEPRTPARSIATGIAMVPRDRLARGTIPALSARENLTLPALRPLWRAGRLDKSLERAEVRRWLANVDAVPRQPEWPLGRFSGGNQQKIVLAKWLRIRPRVLVLDEPTQGVDVGAKATIYDLLARMARDGTALVVCSAETADLAKICERVLVLRDGSVFGEFSGPALSEHALVTATLGAAGRRGAH
jgi:ribose transport system ATP-binding protein